jgi:putative two-component system response regulator
MSAVENPVRILVVDDSEQVRRLLRDLLTPSGYSVTECANGTRALERIAVEAPDLVLLDLELPDINGHEILQSIRSNPATRLMPVIVLTGMATTGEKMRAYAEGVTDFLAKPFSTDELLARMRALVTLKQFADQHEHAERVILAFAKMIDARDPHTAGHSGRVAEFADRIAAKIGFDGVEREEMRRGALFHDVGKIVTPDAVLHKTAQLTAAERAIVEQHPQVGEDLLSDMKTMKKTLPIVRHHHEKLDGSGYPDGISGESIPMAVRIVTVADVFDATTSSRAYRDALSISAAFEILTWGVRKSWWDGRAVEAGGGGGRGGGAGGGGRPPPGAPRYSTWRRPDEGDLAGFCGRPRIPPKTVPAFLQLARRTAFDGRATDHNTRCFNHLCFGPALARLLPLEEGDALVHFAEPEPGSFVWDASSGPFSPRYCSCPCRQSCLRKGMSRKSRIGPRRPTSRSIGRRPLHGRKAATRPLSSEWCRSWR